MARMLTNIRSSLIRMVANEIAAARADNLSTDLAYLNLDEHAAVNEFPSNDVVGLWSFAVDEDPVSFTIHAAVGISTINDPGLFRHYELAARFFERLRGERKIEYVDADDGRIISWIVLVNGTNLMPMSRAEIRPIQFVMFSGLLDPNAA